MKKPKNYCSLSRKSLHGKNLGVFFTLTETPDDYLTDPLLLKLTKQKMESFKSSSPLHKHKSKIQYYLQGFSMIPTLRREVLKEKFFRYDFWVS